MCELLVPRAQAQPAKKGQEALGTRMKKISGKLFTSVRPYVLRLSPTPKRDERIQYVALFPGHPYFRTLQLFASVFRCNNKTNLNDTF